MNAKTKRALNDTIVHYASILQDEENIGIIGTETSKEIVGEMIQISKVIIEDEKNEASANFDKYKTDVQKEVDMRKIDAQSKEQLYDGVNEATKQPCKKLTPEKASLICTIITGGVTTLGVIFKLYALLAGMKLEQDGAITSFTMKTFLSDVFKSK